MDISLIRNMRLLILFFLVPFFLNSQSEGGFGYRRFSNTTTLNNVAVSNIQPSHSRNAYVHSNGLYYVWDGNSWEREHDIDTFSASGTTIFISLYGDGVPAKTLDLSTIPEFGNNIYTTNDTTTDLLRSAFVLRSLWFRGLDSVGFIRWGIRPDNFNGSQFSIYQDSLVNDADTIIWKSSFNTALQYHSLQSENTYYFADSSKNVMMGQFPDFPDVNFDGREKGLIYSPDYLGEVSLYNGSGITGSWSSITVYENDVSMFAVNGNPAARTDAFIRARAGAKSIRLDLTAIGITNPLGSNRIWQQYNDTLNYIALGHANKGALPAAYIVMGTGGNNSSFLDHSAKRKFAVQTHKSPNNNPYNWLEVEIPTTTSDTITDRVKLYNGSYAFKNERPSNVVGDTSIHVWIGDGSGITTPAFMLLSDIVSSSVNIYNSNGTQDDADRLFTVDSSQTLAIGQFSSVSTPTWGRGFYYDPSTANGVRILNKAGDNSSSTKVELDATTLSVGSTHTTSSSSVTHLSINESASFESIINRTSDTYGSLDIVSFTNSNEEIVALKQTGKGTAQSVSMYLGDGYSSSQYARYANRAWGVETLLSSGGYDWIQVLLPDTGTDTTGNNINFYNRAYYWVNDAPSSTVGDTMVHAWVGNGTNSTPLFLDYSTIGNNIYNSNGTTTQNTRTANILESIQWVGTADLGVDPYPFQIHSTGNEPLIQLWKGNADSVWLYQSDVEYHFGSSAQLVVESTDELSLQADSIQASTLETKAKIRNIIGTTSNGWLKKFDGNDELPGAFIVSNGTDWVPGTDLLGGGAAVFGTATLVGGTVTVNTTSALTNSVIIISRNAAAGAVGDLRLGAITNGTSFVINSASGTDTSTVNWWILN